MGQSVADESYAPSQFANPILRWINTWSPQDLEVFEKRGLHSTEYYDLIFDVCGVHYETVEHLHIQYSALIS